MKRVLASTTSITLIFSGAFAQNAPAIPAPPPEARTAYFVSAADANVLPAGRSQSPNAAPAVRISGYAGEKPTTYTRPVGQKVYTSKAYPAAAPAAATASGQARNATPTDAKRTNSPRKYLRGWRAEARLGWDQVKSDGDVGDSTGDALLYGLGIGYDHDFGHMFVGGYASIDWSDAMTGHSIIIAGTPTDTTYDVSSEASQDMELGIRAGYWLGEQLNVYGFAAMTKFEQEVTITNVTDTGTVVRDIDQDGWRVGAGTEYILPHGFYTKAEYRYSNYGDDPAAEGNDLDRHQLLTGVGIRF